MGKAGFDKAALPSDRPSWTLFGRNRFDDDSTSCIRIYRRIGVGQSLGNERFDARIIQRIRGVQLDATDLIADAFEQTVRIIEIHTPSET